MMIKSLTALLALSVLGGCMTVRIDETSVFEPIAFDAKLAEESGERMLEVIRFGRRLERQLELLVAHREGPSRSDRAIHRGECSARTLRFDNWRSRMDDCRARNGQRHVDCSLRRQRNDPPA